MELERLAPRLNSFFVNFMSAFFPAQETSTVASFRSGLMDTPSIDPISVLEVEAVWISACAVVERMRRAAMTFFMETPSVDGMSLSVFTGPMESIVISTGPTNLLTKKKPRARDLGFKFPAIEVVLGEGLEHPRSRNRFCSLS